MNKLVLLTLIFGVILISVHAQSPNAFTYQAVARDASGNVVASKSIGLRLSILNGSTAAYVETFSTQTNAYGMFSVNLGTGTATTGTFAGLDWTTGGSKSLKTEIDLSGGTTYVDVGVTPFASVPYALVATSATNVSLDNLTDVNTTGATTNQVLQWNGSNWVPASIAANNITTSSTLAGNGTSASPLTLAQQGATNDQVLKWNGTSWTPGTFTATVTTNTTMSGDGSVTSPLKIAQQGATSGQVLQYNGSTWAPATISGGIGDNWGNQSAFTDGVTLGGVGTNASPLKIAKQNATNDQVLKWNDASSAWIPGNIIPLSGTANSATLPAILASNDGNGTAIVGQANSGGVGVNGKGLTGIGVLGTSVSGSGVKGTSTSGLAGEFIGTVAVFGDLKVNASHVLVASDVYLFDQSLATEFIPAVTTPDPKPLSGLDAMSFTVNSTASVGTPAKVIITFNNPIVSTTNADAEYYFEIGIKDGVTTIAQTYCYDYIGANKIKTMSYTLHKTISTAGTYTAYVAVHSTGNRVSAGIGGQVQIQVIHQ